MQLAEQGHRKIHGTCQGCGRSASLRASYVPNKKDPKREAVNIGNYCYDCREKGVYKDEKTHRPIKGYNIESLNVEEGVIGDLANKFQKMGTQQGHHDTWKNSKEYKQWKAEQDATSKTKKKAVQTMKKKMAETVRHKVVRKKLVDKTIGTTSEFFPFQLTEKIHPGVDWHKNKPDELLAHVYWMCGKEAPKDLDIRHKAYRGIVKQLHASNPAPSKKVLDTHMNHFVNVSKKKLVRESVVSAAHTTHGTPMSQKDKWDVQQAKDKAKARRKAQMDALMGSVRDEYHKAIAPKAKDEEKAKAKKLAVSDMKKKTNEERLIEDTPKRVSYPPRDYYTGTTTDFSDKKRPFARSTPGPHKKTFGVRATSPEHAHAALHMLAARHGYGLGGVDDIKKDTPHHKHIREENEQINEADMDGGTYRDHARKADYASSQADKHSNLADKHGDSWHHLLAKGAHRVAARLHRKAAEHSYHRDQTGLHDNAAVEHDRWAEHHATQEKMPVIKEEKKTSLSTT